MTDLQDNFPRFTEKRYTVSAVVEWIMDILHLACWEWWNAVVASVSAIATWFTTKFFLGRKFDDIHAEHIINDLEFIEEYMEWWIDNQNPDGSVDFVEKERKDVRKLFSLQTLLEKHSDWVSADYPSKERAKKIWSDASDSIDLIIEHR